MVFIGNDITSVVPEKDNGMRLESLNQIKDLVEGLCVLGNVYCLAIKKDVGVFTSYLGSDIEGDEIAKLVPIHMVYDLCSRFVENGLEDVISYDTGLEYLKMSGFDIRGYGNEQLGVGILIGVIEENIPDDVFVSTYLQKTTSKSFDNSVKLFSSMLKHFFYEKFYALHLEGDLSKVEATGKRLEEQLAKNEVLTNILKMLESENDFSQIAEDILKDTAEYIGIEESLLIKENIEGTGFEVVGEWVLSGKESIADRLSSLNIYELPFMNGKTYTISSGSIMPDEFNKFFNKMDIDAGVFIPIGISGKPGMYLCFMYQGVKKWSVEELRFLNDVKRVFQTILVKRITKNSLASSYAALEAILQNVDCGISVDDLNTSQNLLENDRLKEMIEESEDMSELHQVIEGIDDEVAHIREYRLPISGKWVEITFAKIHWVDGRDARLTSVHDISNIKNFQREIEKQASNDYMTGLYNRKQCEEDLQKEIKLSKLNKTKGALLYLDLDDFKNINDGLGHRIGDQLLIEVAKTIDSVTGDKNRCYRVGGDEFAVLVTAEEFSRLEQICDSIRGVFSRSWQLSDAEYYCTMSMGYVVFPENGNDVQSLMKRADIALSYAKQHGKNRIEAYNESNADDAARRLDVEKCMREAVADGCKEFEVYYQPVVDVSKNETVCCGAEALVRWNSKKFGFMNPAEFIPLAEYLGLIVPIGEHVLIEACKRCKYWNDFGHPEYKINVNLSVVQLIQKDIVDIVENALKVTGINPTNLTLEVTEGLAINDMDAMKKILDGIKNLGVRVALDDFGTGYSSLNHIRSMPLDVIKIDRCFVNGVGEDSFSEAFVKTVSKLADAINVNVCVEGVEQEKQKDALSSMNVQMIQGFLYDKPLPQDEFERKYLI